MLAVGKIVDSESPYGAPTLFVPKPDGSLQLCVDYTNHNKLTILNNYPLPLRDEPLPDCVAGAKVFTKLDQKDQYHLIRMRKGDEPKKPFWSRHRKYEYKVIPFGLFNAPATLHTMIKQILREFLDPGVVVYHYFLFFSLLCNHAFIVLGIKSLIQRELWREQNL